MPRAAPSKIGQRMGRSTSTWWRPRYRGLQATGGRRAATGLAFVDDGSKGRGAAIPCSSIHRLSRCYFALESIRLSILDTSCRANQYYVKRTLTVASHTAIYRVFKAGTDLFAPATMRAVERLELPLEGITLG